MSTNDYTNYLYKNIQPLYATNQLPVWGAAPTSAVERVYEIGRIVTTYGYGSTLTTAPDYYLPFAFSNQSSQDFAQLPTESLTTNPYVNYDVTNDGVYGPLTPQRKTPTRTGPEGPIGQTGPEGPVSYTTGSDYSAYLRSGYITTPADGVRYRSSPNKMSNDKWNNKVAWSSKDLMVRQQELETYSAEVAMMTEAIRQIACKAMSKDVPHESLDFTANFASPIQDNKQLISIQLFQPISLAIRLTRALANGKLDWRVEVGVTRDTPERVEGRMLDMTKLQSDEMLDNISNAAFTSEEKSEEKSKEKKRRKIRL